MDFRDWLLTQLREMDWTQADLARASGLTRATISYYLGPKSKKPDQDALRKIARAFKMNPVTVYRAAGFLPKTSGEDIWTEEMVYKLKQLKGSQRDIASRMLDVLLDEQDREEGRIYKTDDP
jgi:transcriptional regulator with XRE-family HTH domain